MGTSGRRKSRAALILSARSRSVDREILSALEGAREEARRKDRFDKVPNDVRARCRRDGRCGREVTTLSLSLSFIEVGVEAPSLWYEYGDAEDCSSCERRFIDSERRRCLGLGCLSVLEMSPSYAALLSMRVGISSSSSSMSRLSCLSGDDGINERLHSVDRLRLFSGAGWAVVDAAEFGEDVAWPMSLLCTCRTGGGS